MSNKSLIGLKDLVTAELLTDTTAELTYGAVESVAGAIMVELKDESGEADVQDADDVEYDRLYPPPLTGLSMENADIPPAMRAKFFGHAVDTKGVVVVSKDDVPPYRAFGFKSEKADGAYRYIWLYKCIPVKRTADSSHKTKPTKNVAERQTTKIDWEVIPTTYNGEQQAFVDDDTSAFSAAKATFFSAPYVPVVAGDIEISVQPADQYLIGGAGGSLTLTAAVDGGAPDAYQWYKATDKTYGTGVVSAYTGNDGATLTIPTDIADETTHYFFCKLSNAGSRDVYSDIAVVIVGATP